MSTELSNCEQCLHRYSLFRRRKQCYLCGQIFCSKCISKPMSSNKARACTICLLIINDRTTCEQLRSIRVKHLRAYLIHSKIVTSHRLELCLEKQDLINLIQLRREQIPEETYVFVERPNEEITTINIDVEQSNQESTPERNEEIPTSTPIIVIPPTDESQSEPVNEPPPVPIPCTSKVPSKRKTLADVPSLESIHELSIGELKDILNQNFVSYKGCVEKQELIAKLKLLHQDKQQIQSDTSISNGQSDENLCKICMDATIDCVFLDCGHLCTCVQCGKRLSECPLCRSYIIRVVRVFKS
ncbi:hypothetical protein I4U23_010469 [Adineta vaga]|nr:hypothetical protein I4U23_010469 [Adineta vaga]